MRRSFYSVIQYCPDRFRAEAVNVGLAMLCPDPHEVRVAVISRYNRVQKLFGVRGEELKNLKLATLRLKNRIESANGELRTDEDLACFAATRANDLRLPEPRLAKVADLDDDFERLYSKLVEDRPVEMLAVESPAEVLPPSLSEVLYRLQQEQKIWRPGKITVPVSKRKLEIPYAYKNGVVNLIKPHEFPASSRAGAQAATLAVSGDMIRKHRIDGEMHQLVVVSTQETDQQAFEIDDHIEPVFREYGVKLVRPQQAEAFAREVEASAN